MTSRKVHRAVIFPAGGSGRRMRGIQTPKIFLPLGRRKVLDWTLKAFYDTRLFQKAVVVLPKKLLRGKTLQSRLRALYGDWVTLVPGGATRQESVWQGLCATTASGEYQLVAVHDAVRPLVSRELIRRCVRQAASKGAVIAATPAVDTLWRVKGNMLKETLDRETTMHAQTPQVARLDWLLEAYAQAREKHWTVTDEAGLLRRAGRKVYMVTGDPHNLKITTPQDYQLAKKLIQGN